MTVMTKPQQSFRLEPVHPKPEEAHTMPYAPAVRIVGACDLMFLSGATPSPLYHNTRMWTPSTYTRTRSKSRPRVRWRQSSLSSTKPARAGATS